MFSWSKAKPRSWNWKVAPFQFAVKLSIRFVVVLVRRGLNFGIYVLCRFLRGFWIRFCRGALLNSTVGFTWWTLQQFWLRIRHPFDLTRSNKRAKWSTDPHSSAPLRAPRRMPSRPGNAWQQWTRMSSSPSKPQLKPTWRITLTQMHSTLDVSALAAETNITKTKRWLKTKKTTTMEWHQQTRN